MQRRDWVVLVLTGAVLGIVAVIVWKLAKLLTLDQAKSLSAIAQSVCAVIAVFVGGIWALWRYAFKREAQPKIEFALELQVLGAIESKRLVNVVAAITNRGSVRHYLNDFWFNLHPLRDVDSVVIGGVEIDGQVQFGQPDTKRYWITPSRKRFFIDPGVTQRYIHVAAISLSTRFVLVYGHFSYPGSGGREYHSVQQAFDLPAATRSATQSRAADKSRWLFLAVLGTVAWRLLSRLSPAARIKPR